MPKRPALTAVIYPHFTDSDLTNCQIVMVWR